MHRIKLSVQVAIINHSLLTVYKQLDKKPDLILSPIVSFVSPRLQGILSDQRKIPGVAKETIGDMGISKCHKEKNQLLASVPKCDELKQQCNPSPSTEAPSFGV